MPALKGLAKGAGAALALAAPAQACPLALVLAMDVSASVDAVEYRLQTAGTAAALASAPVQAAILADPPVALAVTLWAGQGEQAVVLGWRTLATPADILAAAESISAI